MFVTTTRRPVEALQNLQRLSTTLNKTFTKYQQEDNNAITTA